ncbi:hypothetical protein [Rheinheimera sp. UJ63]|uniref:hypothetical protein n=1 Tax=Rheinheimera sp. UJ63 TaxID=2910157 RepID=UPI001F3BEFBE|nr:hypothetical protein [Rheinheimera sp. UJ63]MCF4010384.1 hypothetical protein [Rheinheimera sp. UJ63]
MKKLLVILLWCWVSFGYAESLPDDVPEWLQQVAAEKNRAPEQMLEILTANQAQFAHLSAVAQAYWLNHQATILSHLGRFQEQQAVAEQGIALLKDNPSSLYAELSYELGFAFEMKLALADAMKWYQKGMATAMAVENERLRLRGLINISAVDSLQNRTHQALQNLQDTYARATQLKDKELLAEVNAQLGLLYSNLSYEQDAQEFLEQALVLYEELGWHKNRVTVLYNLARNYSYLEDFELALQSFERMLQSALKEQDILNLYYAYNGLAITSNEMDKPQVALNYMEKAEEYLAVIHSDYYLASHHYEKALIYQNLQQNTQAMQQLLLAEQYMQTAENSGSGNMLLSFQLLKAELLADQGQYERAFQTMRLFVRGFQQFRDKENELEIAKMRLSFEAEREQVQQNMLEQEYQLNALRLAEVERNRVMQWLWLGMAATLGLFILVVVLLLRRTRSAKATPSSPTRQDQA